MAAAAFPEPQRVVLDGRYTRLEPLDAAAHGADLLATSSEVGAAERFRYLGQEPPGARDHDARDLDAGDLDAGGFDPGGFAAWLATATATTDPLFFAVIDRRDERCHGRQALMRIEPQHGVIELGNVLWNPGIAKTRVATEAFYLSASYVFDALGYRRFEWKCDAANLASRRAATRFGFTFEGVFRQHMIVKGLNRDTAWYAMLDGEWPSLRTAFQGWLEPSNFTADGTQRRSLADLREERSP